MARRNVHGTIRHRTVTKFIDESGRVIHTLGYTKETVHDPQDGSINIITSAESDTLVSGENFNAGMAAGPNPIMLTGVCTLCRASVLRWSRKRSTHGLCNLKQLKRCCQCGVPVCPRHCRQSRYDKHWRCLKHHKIHKWTLRLARIFFAESDD